VPLSRFGDSLLIHVCVFLIKGILLLISIIIMRIQLVELRPDLCIIIKMNTTATMKLKCLMERTILFS
jgi:hypothetical protein